MNARILEVAYRLRQHRMAGWALDRWAVTLAWGAGLLLLLFWALRGRPSLPAWHWVILVLLALVGVVLIVLRTAARRRFYVVFTPRPAVAVPAAAALRPSDKEAVRATGIFDVEGRARIFADLMAYWRTFASREHAVMAIAHESRYLVVGSRPAEDVGMWYAFFLPEAVEAVTAGDLIFGARLRPGLRIDYLRTVPVPDDGKRRSQPRPVRAVFYLACEDEETRARVWGDLLADGERGIEARD
ncbi:MAG: hypothetical protein ACK2U9_09675 [Anaerolineae bacterium]